MNNPQACWLFWAVTVLTLLLAATKWLLQRRGDRPVFIPWLAVLAPFLATWIYLTFDYIRVILTWNNSQ